MSSSTAAPFIESVGGGGGVGTTMSRLSGGSNASAGSTRSLAGCGLCRGPLRDSRVLPGCLHSFCLACLQRFTNGGAAFRCPSCKMAVNLGEGGTLDKLGANTFYNSVNNILESSGGSSAGGGGVGDINDGVAATTLRAPNKLVNGCGGGGGGRDLSIPGWTPSKELQADPAWPLGGGGIWNNRTPLRTPLMGSGGNDTAWKPLSNNGGGGGGGGGQTESNGPVASMPWSSSPVICQPPQTTSAPNAFGFPSSGRGGGSLIPHGGLQCSCGEKSPATHRCHDCSEDLCPTCVSAHQRVKVTRGHKIAPLESKESALPLSRMGVPSLHSPPSSAAAAAASKMHSAPTSSGAAAVSSSADVMRVYADAVDKAKADSEKLMMQAKQELALIADVKGKTADMEVRINMGSKAVQQEVKKMVEAFLATVREREQELLTRLEAVRTTKIEALSEQQQNLVAAEAHIRNIGNEMAACCNGAPGREIALIEVCKKAKAAFADVHANCGPLTVHEDDVFEFSRPQPGANPAGSQIFDLLRTVGYVGGSGFAKNSTAEGDGIKRAILGKDACFTVVVRDHLAEVRQGYNDAVKLVVHSPDQRPVRATIFDNQNGTYRLSWSPAIEGEHVVNVLLKDAHVAGSPFRVTARSGRNYRTIGKQLFEFGGEGSQDGKLCRPWGVSCSREGFILVANRSNNRIEVYSKDGRFRYHFGDSGKGSGQFDRPASVCCDSKDRVIVADKDNHRVQIFTVTGKFLHAFGERGPKVGQFNYPWDVACNSIDQILVSDTRNHRIQLFQPNGDFVTKYGFEGNMWKHFDSPRGVCFTPSDHVVVTDFNNHRLLVIQSDFQSAKYLGKEGAEDGMFTRPNGVAVDEEGHIIVADSRNDRVQVFSSAGVFIRTFGSKGTGPGEFDRPSGISISPEGHVIVVDFGNDRVQVF